MYGDGADNRTPRYGTCVDYDAAYMEYRPGELVTEEERVWQRKKKFLCVLAGGSLNDVASCIDECVKSQLKGLRSYLMEGGSSFFAEAVMNGRQDVVEYFVEHFPAEVRQFLESDPAELPESPFHTACKLYDAKLVRLLIAYGASVHLPDKHRIPPLHAAVSGGRVDVLDALLEHGASINQEDCYGWTPLCVAMSKPDVVTSLLQRGAEVNHRLSSGFTALHLAAQRGSQYFEVYLTANSMPMTPVFQEVPSSNSRSDDDYIPCPLFLAAANCHQLLVRVLVEHPDCPLSCKADALLLLNISRHLTPDESGIARFDLFRIETFVEGWKESLCFREANALQLPQLPPMKVYGNRTEVSSVQELDAVCSSYDELVYQSIIAYERCLGYRRHNSQLAYILCGAASYFLAWKKHSQCELLLERALGLQEFLLLPHPSSICIYPDIYMYLKLRDFRIWLHGMIEQFNSCRYKMRCYSALVRTSENLLEEIKRVHCKPLTSDDILSVQVQRVMLLLYDWHNNLTPDDHSDFQQLGEKFVSTNLHISPGTTLLHLMLSYSAMEKLVVPGVKSFSTFASQILAWGAWHVINEPNSLGSRPIDLAHEAARLLHITRCEDLVSPFVQNRANF